MDETTAAALARLRGGNARVRMSARRLAASLEAPGCARRTILDAALVDVERVAVVLGAPPDRQSPFAITRGIRFERNLTEAAGMAEIIALTREHLGLDIPEVRQADLSQGTVAEAFPEVTNELRATLTRQHVARMLAGDPSACNLLRHPMTALKVGGVVAWLEQDVLAFAVGGRLYVVEIKSYPCIDDRADADKVSASARQSAVYILSLMNLVKDLGFDASTVSKRVLLVMPKDLTLRPVGKVIDVRLPVQRLRRQIAAAPDVAAVVAGLPVKLALPDLPAKSAPEAEKASARAATAVAVAALPAKFGDACLKCPMFRYCRDEAEAQGLTARLGNNTANSCGGVATADRALALADGCAQPMTDSEAALAAYLARGAAAAAMISRATSA